jgi:hypothetical protein
LKKIIALIALVACLGIGGVWAENDDGINTKNIENTESLKSVTTSLPIICYGDSMTGSTSGWVTTLKDTYNLNVINRGIGGETAGQIATRQGGLPLVVEPFTIPSDTKEVAVKMNRGFKAQQSDYEGINPVTIDGIEGTLFNSSNTENGFTFKRSVAGSTKTLINPTPVLTDNMKRLKRNPIVIWVGTNGDYDSGSRTSINLIKIIDRMLSTSDSEDFMVIGLTTDVVYNIPAINRDLEKKYGERFLDLRSYLIKRGLDDMIMTPTATDTIRLAANNVPSSLLQDSTHLKISVQQRIVAPLVHKKLKELNMINN